jgi:hypothetical protein
VPPPRKENILICKVGAPKVAPTLKLKCFQAAAHLEILFSNRGLRPRVENKFPNMLAHPIAGWPPEIEKYICKPARGAGLQILFRNRGRPPPIGFSQTQMGGILAAAQVATWAAVRSALLTAARGVPLAAVWRARYAAATAGSGPAGPPQKNFIKNICGRASSPPAQELFLLGGRFPPGPEVAIPRPSLALIGPVPPAPLESSFKAASEPPQRLSPQRRFLRRST